MDIYIYKVCYIYIYIYMYIYISYLRTLYCIITQQYGTNT